MIKNHHRMTDHQQVIDNLHVPKEEEVRIERRTDMIVIVRLMMLLLNQSQQPRIREFLDPAAERIENHILRIDPPLEGVEVIVLIPEYLNIHRQERITENQLVAAEEMTLDHLVEHPLMVVVAVVQRTNHHLEMSVIQAHPPAEVESQSRRVAVVIGPLNVRQKDNAGKLLMLPYNLRVTCMSVA